MLHIWESPYNDKNETFEPIVMKLGIRHYVARINAMPSFVMIRPTIACDDKITSHQSVTFFSTFLPVTRSAHWECPIIAVDDSNDTMRLGERRRLFYEKNIIVRVWVTLQQKEGFKPLNKNSPA